MAILQADDIADLIKVTQKDLGRLRWTEIASDLQEYVALPKVLQAEKVAYQSGYGIQWNVMVDTSGAAKDTGLFAVDSVNVGDVMQTASAPWRHLTTSYAIERREVAMNRDPARIVELVKIRRADAMIDLAAHMETRFWGRPDDANDNEKLYGVKYWVVTNSGGTEGFTGGAAFGSTVADLNPSTYTNWKNYSARYAAVSSTDLIRDWRKAATFTQFKSPVDIPEYNTGSRYGYYTNYNVIGPLEEVLEAQNDNLGNDIASKDGRLLFRQVPVTWVPHLENTAGDPVYGINWGVFKPVFLSGEYMKEDGPSTAPNQHTVFQTFVDCTMNLMCTDRRRNFVLGTSSLAV